MESSNFKIKLLSSFGGLAYGASKRFNMAFTVLFITQNGTIALAMHLAYATHLCFMFTTSLVDLLFLAVDLAFIEEQMIVSYKSIIYSTS